MYDVHVRTPYCLIARKMSGQYTNNNNNDNHIQFTFVQLSILVGLSPCGATCQTFESHTASEQTTQYENRNRRAETRETNEIRQQQHYFETVRANIRVLKKRQKLGSRHFHICGHFKCYEWGFQDALRHKIVNFLLEIHSPEGILCKKLHTKCLF